MSASKNITLLETLRTTGEKSWSRLGLGLHLFDTRQGQEVHANAHDIFNPIAAAPAARKPVGRSFCISPRGLVVKRRVLA